MRQIIKPKTSILMHAKDIMYPAHGREDVVQFFNSDGFLESHNKTTKTNCTSFKDIRELYFCVPVQIIF